MSMIRRCVWAEKTELDQQYHDEEWGRPVHDEQRLFEMLLLEGQQAGLSWSLILAKRAHMREAFDHFDPCIMAQYGDDKIERLMNDSGIIRNRNKLHALVHNAQAYLRLVEKYGGLDAFLWRYVDGVPIQNQWARQEDVPDKTARSEQISKDLKAQGFKYVGSVIIYAYMQSIGMVNDHTLDCAWHEICKNQAK